MLRLVVNILNKFDVISLNQNRKTVRQYFGYKVIVMFLKVEIRMRREVRSIEAVFQASAPTVARCSCSSSLQLRVSPAPVQEVGGEKAGSPYLASAAVHLGQRDMLSGPVTPGRLQHQ